MKMSPYQAHVISNTHWDREWRYTFQGYRFDLVDMMDRALEVLETTPKYHSFFLDSQTVILEDYLEIRPENEERVRALVKAGRLQIGPWYTLPDAWGCPGEALVRNLLLGHKTAKRFGGVSKVGYTPFNNGQISQFPQLYQGFGIDSCFFYRGIGKHVAPSDFLWDSPDGSRVFGFRFGDYARYNYYYLIYRPGLLGRGLKDRDYNWDPKDIPFHAAVDQLVDRQYGWMNQELKVHEECLAAAMEDCLANTASTATTTQLLYMMGHDHSWPARKEADLIQALQRRADPKKIKISHGSLDKFLKAFRKEAGKLKVFKGEMRHCNKEGLWTNLFGWTLSSRLYLKQENARVNAKLLGAAEPLAAMAWITGSAYPAAFLEIAWKKNLVNHAHDAIVGCSMDPVHREMMTRWADVETISDEIIRRSMRDTASRIGAASLDPNTLQLTLFNPLPHDRTNVEEFIIDIPSTDSKIGFTVETPQGQTVPMQVIAREKYSPTVESGYEVSMPFTVQRCRTKILAENIPGFGYSTLVIRPSSQSPADSGAAHSIVRSNQELENEFFKVIVNSNGSLRVTDILSGRVMDSLGLLEDAAEFGDPWNRLQPPADAPFDTRDVQASVTVLHSGPLEGALQIAYTFVVPKEMASKLARSNERVGIPVVLQVSLRKGVPVIDLKLTIDNRAKDHRLRILFPSGVSKAEFSSADGQFDIVDRPIKTPDGAGWKEPPYSTHPSWSFVDVSDGKDGFGVLHEGLTEYEVVDNESRTVAMTLIRGFGKTVFARPTPEAQCPGAHAYRIALAPHAGGWAEGRLPELAARHCCPLMALESAPTQGNLPLRASFLRVIKGDLIFAAIKQSEDGKSLIARFWNPKERDSAVELESDWAIRKAQFLTLEEKPLEAIKLAKPKLLKFKAPKKKIITLALTLAL